VSNGISCPSCGGWVPTAAIPDDVLKSERGRRNAAKRKTFGARRKGFLTVWRRHNSSVWRCRCSDCLLSSVRGLERQLESRIAAHEAAIGVVPEWAAEERKQARRRRAEVEWAILERQVDDLEVSDGRAA
jgi:hypothetical protein